MRDISTLDRRNGRVHTGVRGEALAAISSGLVQLYSRYCGKGPTRAKAHISGDTIVCVLRDPYTASERTLLDRGERAVVKQMREGLRSAIEAEARAVVEENCGRKVIACLGSTHADPDVAVETFVLEPRPNG